MKKIFKTIGICIGLPILNLFVVSITQSILLIFTKNIEIVKNNIYPLVLIGDIITLILIALILLPSDYGMKDRINIKRIPIKEYFNIIILGIGITILLLFLSSILTKLIPSYNEVANQLATSRGSALQLIITIALIPIYEEIFYRGIIFEYLRKNFNIIVAIVVQALVFGVMHLNLVQGIYTFILGIVLALIYMYSESILGNITVHIIFNLLGILIIPKLLINFPSMSIVLLIIAIVFIIFSSIKMIGKYENRLYA
ncbi:TPA: CPBP family intramembrane metalloprotease [Clostridium perfringens]|jgi:membrane protease YdiL (CAAX protease family)|uniref:CPBP family intramembrane glutamic endopeptidase n=1 Tax=Clostridia TaxID=186801 RepID=UPI0011580685|nr:MULTISPECIES: type II CAAX endopeptidase family protein [Clostridiaceae]EJT5915401.1 CPBP family intramembrane metalloprotease [Clostridium perfringens]EJT6615238.1 CPBP family intramembrane metalloprotease [Clostridium perfringens]MBS5954899.1 CPBP family intramembrane metalloprotease [Paraclostridium bifermentans]MDH5096494.1 CAAX amino terminal protease self- immunity [Clostridium perfringens]HAT4091333.1 CPBP family intramembrane metalloprotease [Clostridium perfringens]